MTKTSDLKSQIIDLLKDENKEQVETYASYCLGLLLGKNKDGTLKAPFMQTKSADACAKGFLKIKALGLVFDGKHITWTSIGISLDYIAYKNKMLLVYPETKFDFEVVKKDDTFNVDKVDGDITYRHIIKDPLQTADVSNIVGAYCVLENARGKFLTTLSKEDIAKHRKGAKTDSIWSVWFKEMVYKTVLKKAFKYHFDDVSKTLDEIDNESIDLDKVYNQEDDDKFEEEKKIVLDKIATTTELKELRLYFRNLSSEITKEEDIVDAFKKKGEELKTKK